MWISDLKCTQKLGAPPMLSLEYDTTELCRVWVTIANFCRKIVSHVAPTLDVTIFIIRGTDISIIAYISIRR